MQPLTFLKVDLRGSTNQHEAFRTVELSGEWPTDWTPEQLRERAADFYGVPLEQVGEPWTIPGPPPTKLPDHVIATVRDALDQAVTLAISDDEKDALAARLVEAMARCFSSATEANGEAGAIALQVARLDAEKLSRIGDALAESLSAVCASAGPKAEDLPHLQDVHARWRQLRESGVGARVR